MKQKKVLLVASVCGAAIGALAVRFGSNILASFPAWILSSMYWEFAAKGAAEAQSSEAKLSRGVHVALPNIAVVLEIVPIRGLGRFLPLTWLSIAAGLAAEFAGLSLAIWARRALGRNWSGEISIKVEHQLIRSGPYRLLRPPIYTGLLVMSIGAALAAGTWLAIVGLAMTVFAYWRKIRLEEKNLDVAFGAEYDGYRRESWALVPGVF
ncbi:MAG TPA: isoprenylcysteine carboxylmethyltransferase family protein [Candidatus Sulfotelmatobacter sp.]